MDKIMHDPLTATEASATAALVERLANPDSLTNMCHMRWRGEPLPSDVEASRIINLCRRLLFPGFFGDGVVTRSNIHYHVGLALEELESILTPQVAAALCFAPGEDEASQSMTSILHRASEITQAFIESLPEMRQLLSTDVVATYRGDPAAISTEEVIFCYPGLRATCNHRVAHRLMELGVPLLPRMISEHAHRETGIDIHPGAKIGASFTIDHGTGVVVGATAIIGTNVKIYQGVTLGARSFDLDENNNPIKGIPRHPIIGDNVVIYSNTTLLGRITVGSGAVIGGNLWITEDVAPGEKLVQARPTNILRFKQ
ncbi:MAG: serine acetyltransferase [Bacteroidales bacterium]|nr:serine acetyltransferase [Bacteroidales bacterium]